MSELSQTMGPDRASAEPARADTEPDRLDGGQAARAQSAEVAAVMRKSADEAESGGPTDAEGMARGGFGGGGGPVPYQRDMEQAFGRDFSGVRAHTGTAAAVACRRLGAEAYAFGQQVAFKSESPSRETVAHELTHVLQQSSGVSRQPSPDAPPAPGGPAPAPGGQAPAPGGPNQGAKGDKDTPDDGGAPTAEEVLRQAEAQKLRGQGAPGSPGQPGAPRSAGPGGPQLKGVVPEDSPAERQAEAVEARIGTGDVRSLVGDLANGHGVALDPDQVTRAFDAKNHELNGWKTTLTARVITNGTTVVQAFHQLGEQAQWNVQSFSSLEANVVATILTAVGFIPVVGTAASLIGSIFYNIYSTAQSNAALRAAMSDASGAMMSAVAQQGQVSLHALGTLDTEHTRLLTLAETARNAGDVAAINAVHPDDGFIETVRQGDVYQRLAREWMLRNTATDYELTSANRFYSRDGVDHDAWQQVRDGSGMSMANQGNELLAGQVRGTLARFGITPDSPVEASDFDRYSRFNGRIADQRRFCSSFSAGSTLRSVYCSGLYFNESWQLRAAFRVQEGLAVNGTRSLDEGWVQHGSAIREDTRGNEANCKEVDFGS